jgi:hypothetical protein
MSMSFWLPTIMYAVVVGILLWSNMHLIKERKDLKIENINLRFQARMKELGETTYPHVSGSIFVLGPECFTDAEEKVVSYKGENYYALPKGTPVKELLEALQDTLDRQADEE